MGKAHDTYEFHKSSLWVGLIPMLVMMGGMSGYLHLNFAKASDVTEIKEIIIARDIRDLMYQVCNGKHTRMVHELLNKSQDRYYAITDERYPWVCDHTHEAGVHSDERGEDDEDV